MVSQKKKKNVEISFVQNVQDILNGNIIIAHTCSYCDGPICEIGYRHLEFLVHLVVAECWSYCWMNHADLCHRNQIDDRMQIWCWMRLENRLLHHLDQCFV